RRGRGRLEAQNTLLSAPSGTADAEPAAGTRELWGSGRLGCHGAHAPRGVREDAARARAACDTVDGRAVPRAGRQDLLGEMLGGVGLRGRRPRRVPLEESATQVTPT